ncbi:Phosphoribosyl 1,2-cyclic phosphate 1,2-diphosphodiesterase [Caprobacter fermentans]|uniref:Phosphoribosyl 1,2-cyclic phosphate 1,2-diphosphodiesterase n=2 Tax=Caproicibacter fermentans TaxID=2576756 RepID=A0A6N8I0E6_9FIRM|nr:PHP domain-containing protein [Caproicibacter fermentans]MVB11556.1 Phosphoribosyl 1,2-cyclic phosphate 1,2-diphosphodiesterase [Caproicibacter fermentans]OCN02750.1 phosphatase [Clostridium sp. W14A]
MAADLHCHTKMSDGSAGIDEIVLMAERSGIPVISVTDHDTFSGSVRAGVIGKRHGVTVIPGAEFSSTDPSTGRRAHILCYFCKRPDRLECLCKQMREERGRAAAAMLRRVTEIYPISQEMVMRRAKGSTAVYKQHIMHALMDAGFAGEIYGAVYSRLFSPQNGLAYVPVRYPEVHDVIKRIHEAEGIAVLAHPGEYDSYELLEQLARDHEIDGVEVWHPGNRKGDEQLFMEIARKYDLIMTGGTDFHGMYKKEAQPLGTCVTPDDQLEKLMKIGASL